MAITIFLSNLSATTPDGKIKIKIGINCAKPIKPKSNGFLVSS